jgi:phosphopantetheinyl transferase
MGNDERGRPWIHAPGDEPLAVSLAHTAGFGVAIVRPGAGARVGIDIEAVDAAGDIGNLALTHDEHLLIRRLADEGGDGQRLWTTRVWTAKEAVAKAEGTGLAGRPHDFAVVDATASTLTVVSHGERTHPVSCGLVGSPPSHVVAWTANAPPCPASSIPEPARLRGRSP